MQFKIKRHLDQNELKKKCKHVFLKGLLQTEKGFGILFRTKYKRPKV